MLHLSLRSENGSEHTLSYNTSRLKRFTRLTPDTISITRHFRPERERVEQFIAGVFAREYGARIHTHYPVLMSVRNREDVILGALGFRCAADEPLFLEQYLDAPVEEAVSGVYGMPAAREGIIEIGSLASEGDGASIFLITALMAYLQQQGFRHVTFTATSYLYKYFRVIGVDPCVIAAADQSRLSDGGASWGSYYDAQPRVIAGDVGFAARRLHEHLGVTLSPQHSGLLTRLHYREEP